MTKATLTPDQALVILNAVGLPALKSEQRLTKSVIGAIPLDRMDYRPDPVTRTAIELAWHIVTTESRFLEAVVAGAFDYTPRDRPASVRTPEDVNRWYDEQSQRN